MNNLFKDQTGRSVLIESPPARIVSVVPSQTELLYSLGLEKKVVGITKFCIHPPSWFRSKTRVGGTKNLKVDKIRELKPDLIIANKEENDKEQILELANEFPVWISDIESYKEALEMIREIGKITSLQPEAEKVVIDIEAGFQRLQPLKKPLKAAYLIWYEPVMCAGKNTFINELLMMCNITNISDSFAGRYPELSMDELQAVNPELILLSSEPYPFGEKHLKKFRENFPESKVLTVDGELFSWYGSRLIEAPLYFNRLLRSLETTQYI